ncbi:MAG: protease HtpX [Pseudohongiellaceae bacterium]
MNRALLFISTNFAILLVVGAVLYIVLPLLGITLTGNNLALLLMCAVFGMGGSFLSLAISKFIAKRSVGAYIIETPQSQQETWLLDTVRRQAQKAGIGMPEVAIYDSPEINAFATGASRNNALVAVSTGLLRQMTADEAEAVLGHEVSHVANGDMVTLTLIQGVLNTFVYFFAYLIANAINRGNNRFFAYYMTVMACQAVFGMFASIIVMAFSRYREYRADHGGASLAGRQKMIAALQRLRGDQVESQLEGQLTAFGINGKSSVLATLFMSHPPLEKRIKALQESYDLV